MGITKGETSLKVTLQDVWLVGIGVGIGCVAGWLAVRQRRTRVAFLVTMAVAGAAQVVAAVVAIVRASEVLASREYTRSDYMLFVPVPGLVFLGMAGAGLIFPGLEVRVSKTPDLNNPLQVAIRRAVKVQRQGAGISSAAGAVAALGLAWVVVVRGLDSTGLVVPILVASSVLFGVLAGYLLDGSGRYSRPRRVVQVIAGIILSVLSGAVLFGLARTGPLPGWALSLLIAAVGAGVMAVVLWVLETRRAARVQEQSLHPPVDRPL